MFVKSAKNLRSNKSRRIFGVLMAITLQHTTQSTMINLSNFRKEMAFFLDMQIIDGTEDLCARIDKTNSLAFGLHKPGAALVKGETVICAASNLYALLVAPGIVNPDDMTNEEQANKAAQIIHEWALSQK